MSRARTRRDLLCAALRAEQSVELIRHSSSPKLAMLCECHESARPLWPSHVWYIQLTSPSVFGSTHESWWCGCYDRDGLGTPAFDVDCTAPVGAFRVALTPVVENSAQARIALVRAGMFEIFARTASFSSCVTSVQGAKGTFCDVLGSHMLGRVVARWELGIGSRVVAL